MVIELIAPLGAAIIAGVSWSTLGIFNKWRSGESSTIDKEKLKKNVIIGTILGAATMGYGVYTGEASTLIITANGFITAIAAYFPLIVVVDKLFNKKEE